MLTLRDDRTGEQIGSPVAVSESQIELLDREIGPIQNPVAIRNVRQARTRPDGTVTIKAADESVEWTDPESNALVAAAWDTDPTSHPAYKAGLAAAMETPATGSPSDEVPVVVDLTTGERIEYELVSANGAPFEPVKVYPEPGGIVAFSEDNVMVRWEGDEEVDRLDLGGFHLVRTQFGDLIGVLTEQPGGSVVADLVTTEPEARSLFRVGAPTAREIHPSHDGGLHVIDEGGILTTHDPAGEVIGEVDTGVERVGFIAVDPATGKVALVASPRDLVFVDPETGEVDRVPDVGRISTLGFGRDGELLVLTFLDGRVRLWDVEQGQYAGQAWSGAGQGNTGSPTWYDETTETMWVASSGRYLGLPLDPERWVERACEIVARELTEGEWDTLVPGDEPQRPACP